jgi:hypothetical protein
MAMIDQLSAAQNYAALRYELREYQPKNDLVEMDSYLAMPGATEVPVPGMQEDFIRFSAVDATDKYTLRSTGCLLQGVVGRSRATGEWLSMVSHSSILCMQHRQSIRDRLGAAMADCHRAMEPGTTVSFFAGSSIFIDTTRITTYVDFVETLAYEAERELGIPSQVLMPPKVVPHTCTHLHVHTSEPRAVVRQSLQGLPPEFLCHFEAADVRQRLGKILEQVEELQWR